MAGAWETKGSTLGVVAAWLSQRQILGDRIGGRRGRSRRLDVVVGKEERGSLIYGATAQPACCCCLIYVAVTPNRASVDAISTPHMYYPRGRFCQLFKITFEPFIAQYNNLI